MALAARRVVCFVMLKASCQMSVAAAAQAAPTPVLSLRNISVTFGGVKALQDVGFEVLPGEVQCIAGENGSGKSTLIKVITGVYQPLPGSAVLHRRPSRSTQCRRRWRAPAGVRGHLAGSRAVQRNDASPRTSRIEAVLGARRGSSIIGAMRAHRAASALARLGADLDVDAPLGSFADRAAADRRHRAGAGARGARSSSWTSRPRR